ncbi:MAG: DUF2934 domain-containing protein [Verrucomicrobiota bacterium]
MKTTKPKTQKITPLTIASKSSAAKPAAIKATVAKPAVAPARPATRKKVAVAAKPVRPRAKAVVATVPKPATIAPASTSFSIPAVTPKTNSAPAPRPEITTEAIAARAYSLWEQFGRPQGRDEEFWLLAESQLKSSPLPTA